MRYELISKISTGLAGREWEGVWIERIRVRKVVPPKATGFGGCRTGGDTKLEGGGWGGDGNNNRKMEMISALRTNTAKGFEKQVTRSCKIVCLSN